MVAGHGRSPSGERGLKYRPAGKRRTIAGSLPIRGAWIEICPEQKGDGMYLRRSPSGERGLKWLIIHVKIRGSHRRSPSGERGLKSRPRWGIRGLRGSLPIRGAWIEITIRVRGRPSRRSLPIRGAWIEIMSSSCSCSNTPSLPIRGAWIEIDCLSRVSRACVVASHPGSVD